jgi:hypothetical protein
LQIAVPLAMPPAALQAVGPRATEAVRRPDAIAGR